MPSPFKTTWTLANVLQSGDINLESEPIHLLRTSLLVGLTTRQAREG